MRKLSSPTAGDETALKKIGKYLLGRPRLVSVFKYGERGGEERDGLIRSERD